VSPDGSRTGPETFLFMDIEDHSGSWRDHESSMGAALARHDATTRDAIETRGNSGI
jgi:hypothetical protein